MNHTHRLEEVVLCCTKYICIHKNICRFSFTQISTTRLILVCIRFCCEINHFAVIDNPVNYFIILLNSGINQESKISI